VSGSFPAPVLAGGSGTIDLVVGNAGLDDAVVGLTLELPSGVRFDAGEGGVYIDPDDDSPRCTVEVAAGSTATVSARVLLERAVVGRLQVVGDLDEPVITDIAAIPDLVHSSVGRGDVVVIGNTVTRCAPRAAASDGIDCGAVADGTGEVVNRWDVPIEFVGGDANFGLFNASGAELTIPEGATILEAHLFWGGDLDEGGIAIPDEGGIAIPDDGLNTTIALGLPGGRVSTIEAGRVVLGDVDASQYLGSNDITDLVRDGGPGSYTVGNVRTVEAQGSFGAWALAVVYDHPDAPRRQRLVTRPFEWVAPSDGENPRYEYAADIPIPLVGAVAGELDVFGLEGELGFAPERFTAGDQVLGGDNPFNSTIDDGERNPSEINNLGVDIDTYALDIDASNGTLPLRVSSEFDGIRVAVLGLTVDLPT